MLERVVLGLAAVPISLSLHATALAQDVPGIEICTVEKTMERRTSCLQSNVDFLMKSITKSAAEGQIKLDAANRRIELLQNAVIALQKTVEELQAQQRKLDASAPARGNTAPGGPEAAAPVSKEPIKK